MSCNFFLLSTLVYFIGPCFFFFEEKKVIKKGIALFVCVI